MAKAAERKVLSVAALLVTQVPPDWTVERVDGKWSMFGEAFDQDGGAFVRFKRGDVVVVLNLSLPGSDRWSKYERERVWIGVTVEGDTLYQGSVVYSSRD